MINLSTKFKVFIFTHYEDTKCDTKYRKWDGFGAVKITQGYWK